MLYCRSILLLFLLSFSNSLIPSYRKYAYTSRSLLRTGPPSSSCKRELTIPQHSNSLQSNHLSVNKTNRFKQLFNAGYEKTCQVVGGIQALLLHMSKFNPRTMSKNSLQRIIPLYFLSILFSLTPWKPSIVKASVGMVGDNPTSSNVSPWQGLAIWGTLFTLSAILHSAESAITKLSTWKIQQFSEEEGPTSPFSTLSANITKLLITILLTTTACSIYSTALFVTSINRLFPKLSLGIVTAALTAITLFFGELLPKALAVSNSEYVARKLVPLISPYSTLLAPLTSTVTILSDLILRMFGMRSEEDRTVSEDMLRLVVDEAQRSDEGIETGEGRMIKNVLDMQDKEVGRIMQPRIEIVAVSETSSASDILQVAVMTKYSRIPVYRADIDHIVGVIFSKDLLDFIQMPSSETQSTTTSTTTSSSDVKQLLPKLADSWNYLTAKDLMEKPYFIPETMSCWNALQEMRRRRVHSAIVVDEYGGTSGLVTFEDILEEVVGEIYDEDDDRDEQVDDWTIFRNEDGKTFKMKAYAELDDVFEALAIDREKAMEGVGEYSTIGGLLCSIAGRIPQEGDEIVFGDYIFFIEKVEDNRRIVDIQVSPVIRSTSGENSGAGAVDESNSFETESYASESERSYEEIVDINSSDNTYLPIVSNDRGGEDKTSNQETKLSDNSSAIVESREASGISSSSSDSVSGGVVGGGGNRYVVEKYDSKNSKKLIFLDGEWIDPNSILEEDNK